MRNLKRALSLALASVMLLGMMVVGTSAASYPDVDAANNMEAIEVLKAVGVMTGDENGNFNPGNNVTRNEMAVVMCNLLGLTPGGTTPFTDVPAWAQPYVAACYNNGIIAGTSATTFGGSANVTAVQGGLMVMKALGYFGYQGEFGDDWKLATVKQANQIDLYDGINAYTDKNMTRNEIAQMVLNALECTVMVVREEGGMSVDGNGISVSVKPSYDKVSAQNNSGTDYRGAIGTYGTSMQLCEKLYGNNLKKNSNSNDSFGRPTTEWTYKDSTISTPKAASLTYTTEVQVKSISASLGVELAAANVLYRQNGAAEASSYDKDSNVLTGVALNESTTNKLGGKGTVVEVYYDRDAATDKAIVVIYDYYLAKATEDYNTTDKDIDINVYVGAGTASETLEAKDFALITNLKKDDYVVVTYTAAGDVKSVALPEIVEDAKVSSARDNDYVVAGGTKYEYNKTAWNSTTNAVGKSLMNNATSYSINDDGYNLYLDPNGYVLGVEGYDAGVKLDNYLFIKQTGSNGFDKIGKALFADGTTKTITVAKVDGNSTFAWADDVGSGGQNGLFYSYKVNSKGTYELTVVAASGTPGAKVMQVAAGDKDITNKAYPIESNTTQLANANTVFIAKDKVYTGVKNAPSITSVTGTSSQNEVYSLYDDANRLLWVYATQAGSNTVNTKDLVYILSNDAAVAKDGDDTYYVYYAIVNGEKTTLEANDDNKPVGLYKIGTYTDGRADLGSALADNAESGTVNIFVAAAAQTAYKDGTLTLDSGKSYVLADDAKIFTIDGTTVKTISADAVAKAVADGFNQATVIEKSSTDDTAITVYLKK